MPLISKSPYLRSQSCSRLLEVSKGMKPVHRQPLLTMAEVVVLLVIRNEPHSVIMGHVFCIPRDEIYKYG
jgi:hypothetical protein